MVALNSSDARVFQGKRVAPRLPFRPDIPCDALDPRSGKLWPAWVRDISLSGISLLLEQQFPVGDVIVVQVRLPHEEHFLLREMEVRHSEICFPNNAWLHGCQFREPIPEADLLRLIWKSSISVHK